MSDLIGIALSIFFGFVPAFLFAMIVYWLDRFEKEPKVLLGMVFFWGAVVAAGGSFILNTVLGLGVYFLTGSEFATELSTGSVFAPFVEESLKGIAVLVVFLLIRHEFDSILDGIVYASITALGFAATENVYYILSFGYYESGFEGLAWLAFVRTFLVGWQHPFYTSFIGIGLAVARLNRGTLIKVSAPVLGWGVAVMAHSVHNTLASFINSFGGLVATTLLDWSGWLAMVLFIIWAIYREQHWITQQLHEEVTLGTITTDQYRTACSAWAQISARMNGIRSGKYRDTSRFYQLTAELAHKKHQRNQLGEEIGHTEAIHKLRTEISQLGPLVLH